MTTNVYEMMFILRPDLSGEQVNKQLHKYNTFLKDNGAQKVSLEVWGKRRLAYLIQKFQDGIYVLAYYTGDGTQVAKIEREMRFSDDILRYLTIKQEPSFEFEEKAIPELQSNSVEPKEEISLASDNQPEEEVTPTVSETEEVAVATEEETTEETTENTTEDTTEDTTEEATVEA